MATQCADIDNVLRDINKRMRKLKNLQGESLTHHDEEFETFKKGLFNVRDYCSIN